MRIMDIIISWIDWSMSGVDICREAKVEGNQYNASNMRT